MNAMVQDPICRMMIDAGKAVVARHGGTTYYFCSEGCRDRFMERKEGRRRTSYEIIIIGGGPAGLTAGVYAATMKTDAFLISRDLGGQAIDSTKIRNYMGYDFITGPELVKKFRHQLIRSHYIDHLMSDVEKIDPAEEGFMVTTSNLERYSASALIVATGMTRRTLGVPGEEEFQRRGVFYGNIQDYSYLHGEDAAVIGGGNSALQIVENLLPVARIVHVVTEFALTADPTDLVRLEGAGNLKRHEGYRVVELTGKNLLSGVTIRRRGGEETVRIPAKGVFIAVGLQPKSALVSHLVDLNERGEIVIKPDCATSCPGIFGAGDVTNAFGKRIIIASGEGAKAALAARQYLLDRGVNNRLTAAVEGR